MITTEPPAAAETTKAELWAEVKRLRRERDLVATLPLLERLCADHPAETRFIVCMAEALIDAGRIDDGRALLERARSLDPADPRPGELLRKIDGQAAAAAPVSAELQASRAALKQELEALASGGGHEAVIATYHAAARTQPELVGDIENWAPMVNASGRALYQANDERPTPWTQAVIGEVHERGIAIRPFEEVFADTALLAPLQAVARTTQDWTVPGKPHFFKAIREDEAESGHPVMRAALHPRLLEVVCEFYGLYPRLASANIVQTRTDASAARQRRSSEGWHRDPEDTPMLKAFIYLNDVLEIGHGPFQYIPASRPGGLHEPLLPRFGRGLYDKSYKLRPDWSRVDGEVMAEDVVTVLGKAGTVFFCNTSGLHRGGFCTNQDRYMCAYVYQRPGSQFPTYVKTDIDAETAPVAIRMAVRQP
ncbi:MAG TPA: tetratricopeptide repeat protein [Caulobacteraceae bacterium]